MQEISITASVFPTEDENRVKQAVQNIFPGSEATLVGEEIRARASDINTLREKLARQKIRNTVRGMLLRAIRGNTIHFHLSKQAAFAGRVNFSEGDGILNDLNIYIETEDPGELVRQLTGIEEALE